MNTSPQQADILYEEWVPAGIIVRVLVFGLAIPIFIALIAISIVVPEAVSHVATIIGLIAMVVMLLTFWNYRGIKITVTGKAFDAKYGILNRVHIPMAELQRCEPVSSTFSKYLGIGVRYGVDGSYAYTTSFGPAVRIIRAKGRPFLVSTKDPQAICEAVLKAKGLSQVVA